MIRSLVCKLIWNALAGSRRNLWEGIFGVVVACRICVRAQRSTFARRNISGIMGCGGRRGSSNLTEHTVATIQR